MNDTTTLIAQINFKSCLLILRKNPPSTFIDFLEFSTLHSSFIRFYVLVFSKNSSFIPSSTFIKEMRVCVMSSKRSLHVSYKITTLQTTTYWRRPLTMFLLFFPYLFMCKYLIYISTISVREGAQWEISKFFFKPLLMQTWVVRGVNIDQKNLEEY